MNTLAKKLTSTFSNEQQNADTLWRKSQQVRDTMISLFQGKQQTCDLALGAILTSSHVLIEDVPGIGKTTFVKALAKLCGMPMRRVQFTSDLLPSDILGMSLYHPKSQEFEFRAGPIFTSLLMADELNRASSRTQSALLEAMGEGRVTMDGVTRDLPKNFIVFATQNPNDHVGTYTLPESELDRFSMQIKIDYPEAERERMILKSGVLDPVLQLQPVLSEGDIAAISETIHAIHTDEKLLSQVISLLDATRNHADLKLGISTRGALMWTRIAKSFAFLRERNFVTPDDFIDSATACLGHRVIAAPGVNAKTVIQQLLLSHQLG